MFQTSWLAADTCTFGNSPGEAGVWELARKVTRYFCPAVRPDIVVLSVAPLCKKATWFPSGTVPLSAYRLAPPAGLSPARLGLSTVQPVIDALSEIKPGYVLKVLASKLGLGMV